MRRPTRSGFTFVEMMTAISIICILAAILFPVFARAREKAYQTGCASNLRNIGMALRVYSTEHFGHFPPADNDLWPLVPKHLTDKEALTCPTVSGLVKRIEEGRLLPARSAQDEWPPPGRRDDPPDRPCDYIYRGGFCDDDQPQTTLAGDDTDSRHNGGANYLFLDGHVKWMNARAQPELPGGLEDLRKLGHVTEQEEPGFPYE